MGGTCTTHKHILYSFFLFYVKLIGFILHTYITYLR
nr:MAG TPA: hypothetical protein [Caudoviricetes sp.]